MSIKKVSLYPLPLNQVSQARPAPESKTHFISEAPENARKTQDIPHDSQTRYVYRVADIRDKFLSTSRLCYV